MSETSMFVVAAPGDIVCSGKWSLLPNGAAASGTFPLSTLTSGSLGGPALWLVL